MLDILTGYNEVVKITNEEQLSDENKINLLNGINEMDNLHMANLRKVFNLVVPDVEESKFDFSNPYYCYMVDGVIVGYLQGEIFSEGDNNRVILKRVWVNPLYRKKGIGTQLVNHYIELTKKEVGCFDLTVYKYSTDYERKLRITKESYDYSRSY